MCYTYHMLALLKLDGIALGFAGADLIALPVVIAILVFRNRRRKRAGKEPGSGV
jgi:hypothetical protein